MKYTNLNIKYILALDCTLIYLDDVSPTKSGVDNPVNFSSLLSKGKHVLGRAPGTGGIALVSLVGFPYWFLLKVLLSHPVHCLYCIMSRLTRRVWLLAYTGCENTRPPFNSVPFLFSILRIGKPQDPTLSSKHAAITHNGTEFCIEDMGSRNGTVLVNPTSGIPGCVRRTYLPTYLPTYVNTYPSLY